MNNVKINIQIPPMEIGKFADLVLMGVESPKDLLDSLLFWALHFLESAPEDMSVVKKRDELKEAIDQMEHSLKPKCGFHDTEFKCIIKMFETEMSHHIYK